jgi:hypothetical protein
LFLASQASETDSLEELLFSITFQLRVGDSGGCRSSVPGMPITRSGMMAITIPG